MLKRLWFLFAVPWAALILWLGGRNGETIQLHVWVDALGPLAVPWLMGRAWRFVVSGRVTAPPPLPPFRKF